MKKICITSAIVFIGLIFVSAAAAFIPEIDDEVLVLIDDVGAIDIDQAEIKLDIGNGQLNEAKIEDEEAEIKIEIDDGLVKRIKIENKQAEIKIEIKDGLVNRIKIETPGNEMMPTTPGNEMEPVLIKINEFLGYLGLDAIW